ncbi:hypothetical protein MRY87_13195 [bacterium]|nr:hypothetical protein [bacterium]
MANINSDNRRLECANVGDGWDEYSEQPRGHSVGYFYLRSRDNLRFGIKSAGEYYRPGETFEAVNNRQAEIGHAAHDRVMIFDVTGAERERAKKEWLPEHICVMRDGKVIERITAVNESPLARFLDSIDNDVARMCDFMNSRYPLAAEGEDLEDLDLPEPG